MVIYKLCNYGYISSFFFINFRLILLFTFILHLCVFSWLTWVFFFLRFFRFGSWLTHYFFCVFCYLFVFVFQVSNSDNWILPFRFRSLSLFCILEPYFDSLYSIKGILSFLWGNMFILFILR